MIDYLRGIKDLHILQTYRLTKLTYIHSLGLV